LYSKRLENIESDKLRGKEKKALYYSQLRHYGYIGFYIWNFGHVLEYFVEALRYKPEDYGFNFS